VQRASSPSRRGRHRRGRARSPRPETRPPAPLLKPSLVPPLRRLHHRRPLPTRSRLRIPYRYGIRLRRSNRSNRFGPGWDLGRRLSSLTRLLRPHSKPQRRPHPLKPRPLQPQPRQPRPVQRLPRQPRPVQRLPRPVQRHRRHLRQRSRAPVRSLYRRPAQERRQRVPQPLVQQPAWPPLPQPRCVPKRQSRSRARPSRQVVPMTQPGTRHQSRGLSIRHQVRLPWDHRPGRRRHPYTLGLPAHSRSRHQFRRSRLRQRSQPQPSLPHRQGPPHRRATQQSPRWAWRGVLERRGCGFRGSTHGR
jgi:hypothetical protein